jgi:hypothetical protein
MIIRIALNASDAAEASKISMALTLLSTTYSAESRWIVGVKRLVELFGKSV